MEASTVKQINEMESDMLVPAIEAKLANVWDHVENDDPEGKWTSRQAVGLKIGSETIRATFWGYPDLKPDKGKSFRIESVKGQKGWFGIKTQDNTWKMDNGKKDSKGKLVTEPERELTISDSAQMMPLSGDGSRDAGSPMSDTPAPSNTPTTKFLRSNGSIHADGLTGLQRAQNQLKRVKLATEMVIDMVHSLKTDVNELGEAGMAQVLVTAYRAIDIDSLPTGDEPKAEPAPEPEAPMTPEKAEEILGNKTKDEDGEEIPF